MGPLCGDFTPRLGIRQGQPWRCNALENMVDREEDLNGSQLQEMTLNNNGEPNGELNSSSENEKSLVQEQQSKRLSIDKLIADQRRVIERDITRSITNEPKPGCSTDKTPDQLAEEKANKLVKYAELPKSECYSLQVRVFLFLLMSLIRIITKL